MGCISWTYPDWLGSFYPPGTKSSEFLSLYSRVFDVVEIDSTFYHIPTLSSVRQWKEKTPEGFQFSVKLPKRITHEARLKEVSLVLKKFESAILGLETRLACVMTQLPPNLKFEKGYDLLSKFLEQVDPRIRYVIEFRDVSWFRKETYDLLEKRNVPLVWSINDSTGQSINPVITSDILYLRFMGKFGEFSRFSRVQKVKTEVLDKSLEKLVELSDSKNRAYIMASNHFEGFAPATANSCRKLLGLPELTWAEKMSVPK